MNSNNLSISYIMPVRNESQHIGGAINSILSQDHNGIDFEIIVADGMSTDNTRIIIEELMVSETRIKLIDNPEKIVSSGFNRALSISKGYYIIRLDGHALLSYDFLKNCLEQFKQTNADCVGGPIKNISKGIISCAIASALQSKFGVGNVSFRHVVNSGRYVDTLAFGAYNRQVFEKIGGYDIELVRNQDDEFNYRMNQNNLNIWMHPSIISFYYNQATIVGLFKQYFNYGLFKVRVFQKRRGLASKRHIIPFLFVNFYVFLVFLYIVFEMATPLILFSGLYSALCLSFAIQNYYKGLNRALSLPFIPLCFLTLHISYGIGTLIGFIVYFNKWGDRYLKDEHFIREKFVRSAK